MNDPRLLEIMDKLLVKSQQNSEDRLFRIEKALRIAASGLRYATVSHKNQIKDICEQTLLEVDRVLLGEII